MREYFTQMEAAKKGIITPEMKTVAEKEFLEAETIRERVALGQIAIPANVRHTSLCAEGIGKGLRTKINVNLGISGDANNYVWRCALGRRPLWICPTTGKPTPSGSSSSSCLRR